MRRYVRRARDGETDVTVARHLRVAGMDPHAHLHLYAVRPAMLRQRPLGVGCGRDGLTRPSEGDEERLGLPVDDHAGVRGNACSSNSRCSATTSW